MGQKITTFDKNYKLNLNLNFYLKKNDIYLKKNNLLEKKIDNILDSSYLTNDIYHKKIQQYLLGFESSPKINYKKPNNDFKELINIVYLNNS